MWISEDLGNLYDDWYRTEHDAPPLIDTAGQMFLDGSELIGGSMGDLGTDSRIGSNNNAFDFNGTIDNVMIFDKALTAEEVELLYEAGMD